MRPTLRRLARFPDNRFRRTWPGLLRGSSGPPVVNPDGSVNPITITEESTDIPGVQADSIVYQGSGWVLWNDTNEGPVSVNGDGTASIEFDPGAGINVVTYTNGRTPTAD